jgi:hypothetical protein
MTTAKVEPTIKEAIGGIFEDSNVEFSRVTFDAWRAVPENLNKLVLVCCSQHFPLI